MKNLPQSQAAMKKRQLRQLKITLLNSLENAINSIDFGCEMDIIKGYLLKANACAIEAFGDLTNAQRSAYFRDEMKEQRRSNNSSAA